MKWFKRTYLSIVRRPIKSLLLFLVAFVMGNLLAGSLSIITTSEIIRDELEAGIGANSTIYNIEYVSDKTIEDEYKSIVKELCEDEKILSGEYMYNIYSYIEYGNEEIDVFLHGTNVVEPGIVRDGKIKIKKTFESRNFTQEEIDNGEMVALVHIDYGQDSDGFPTPFGEVGNTVTLSLPLYDENNECKIFHFDVKVVGIYQSYDYINSFFIPSKALEKIMDNATEFAIENNLEIPSCSMTNVMFRFEGLEGLKEFDEIAKDKISNISEYYKYSSATDSYVRSAGPVDNLDAIAKVIFVVSIIATVLILGMVIVFFISERQKEIGIYSSLGERKKNLILQILCEIILISTLAISCASVTGLLLGNKLSDYMLEVQRYTKRQQDLGAIAQLPVIYKPVDSVLDDYDRDSVINCYETQPTAEYFSLLFVIASGTVLVSCVVPMIYLTKLKPKDILI